MTRDPSYDRYRFAHVVPGPKGKWLSFNSVIKDDAARQDDRYHIVMDGDRLDVLAWKYLGDARLWWVIAEYNNIFWFFDIETGDELRIPSFEHLHMDLLL